MHEIKDGRPVPAEHGQPAVTTMAIDEVYTHEEGADAVALLRHMNSHQQVTRLPGHEAFVAVVRTWSSVSSEAPTWVVSDNIDMQHVLAAYWDIPEGYPADLEMTHHTRSGPPGYGPAPEPEASA